MKKAYSRKLLNKTFLIRESRFAPLQRLGYDQAMAKVREFRRTGYYDQGQFCLEQICEQIKTVPEPHLYLLNIYLDMMQVDKAQVLVNQVLKNFPRDNSVLTNCARHFQTLNDIPAALALLDKAIALCPANDENHTMLGLVLLAAGDRSRALLAFNAALKRNPGNTSALLGRARSVPADQGMELAEPIEQLLATAKLKKVDYVELQFTLARLFEKENIKRHFDHLHLANGAAKTTRPYKASEQGQLTEAIQNEFTPESINRLKGLSASNLSPVMIAAMPRSGTTLLEQMLGAHTQLANIGESMAFRTALEDGAVHGSAPSITDNEKMLAWIQHVGHRFENNYFVLEAGSKRVVDKSIDNYVNLARIVMVYPRARIIDLRRHPLDIIYSCYRQNFAAGHNYAFDLNDLAEQYIIYRRMMDHWRELFPENILSVSYETLVRTPRPILRNILEFCDLQWEDACLNYRDDIAVVNTASAEQVRRPLYATSVYSWEGVARYLAPAVAGLGEYARYEPLEI